MTKDAEGEGLLAEHLCCLRGDGQFEPGPILLVLDGSHKQGKKDWKPEFRVRLIESKRLKSCGSKDDALQAVV